MSAIVHIVDDDASFRTATQGLLRASGYAVETYGSAEQLLQRLPDDAGPSPSRCLRTTARYRISVRPARPVVRFPASAPPARMFHSVKPRSGLRSSLSGARRAGWSRKRQESRERAPDRVILGQLIVFEPARLHACEEHRRSWKNSRAISLDKVRGWGANCDNEIGWLCAYRA